MNEQTEDRRWMERALALAARGEGRVEPNPMVGAVIVRDGRVLGEGYHAGFGGPHAEAAALRAARDGREDAAGSTMYVTLEPCAHYGKTPPCAPAIVQAGVRRVVIATADPLWRRHVEDRGDAGPADDARRRAGGERGPDILAAAGIETDVGICRDEAAILNAAFFKRCATGLPLVIAKWAMSADGKIATHRGESRWISSAESRSLVHRLRGRVDAVLVGGGTAERDDPMLTCREGAALRTAERVVLCGRRTPAPDSALARSAREIPVLLAYCDDSPPAGLDALGAAGCVMLPLPAGPGTPGAVDVPSLLRALAERGATSVLVEGGGEVLGSFFDARMVDRALVFIAPFIVGGAEAVTAVGGRGVPEIKAAVPFVGRFTAERGEDAEGCGGGARDALRTDVRIVGRDVMLDAWVSDPREWAP